jgi:hypothetical protein
MLDDKCKFYQIYNVCSFPAPKQKEKNKKKLIYLHMQISLKSNNVEFVRYCGGHFENGDR